MNLNELTSLTLNQAQKADFAGYDPFDGLNSRLFSAFPFLKKGIVGLIWTQFHKRSIINFRPLCLVPKRRNPKGVALFILGLLNDYERTQHEGYLREAVVLGNWLLTQQSDLTVWQHPSWGYHFDWNARAFFVEKGKPNIITTVYVAKALLALSNITQDKRYLESAIGAGHFIVNTLFCQQDNRTYFAYIPDESAFVHNASLWGAAWVARVGQLIDNKDYIDLALKVARQSVGEQNSDGSWVYGARHHHQFIDGFHTGYNLEALYEIQDVLSTQEFSDAIDKGLTFYKQNLFSDDGEAKYYHNNKYPLDMHSVAQAVLTLVKVGRQNDDFELVDKIIKRAIVALYLPKKFRFRYQRNRYFSNNISYIRWTQAWVYYSFSYLNHILKQHGNTHD